MRQVRLLDCTLRDGGYINDWKFGCDTLLSVFERLISAGVDVIEVGFLDERRPFDSNSSIMPDTASVEKIFGGVNKGSAMVVAMIDYGTCRIEHLQPAAISYLDGIRVIFKKHIMHEAIDFCKQVKALGYKVFTQAVSITSYNDDELLELAGLVNAMKPFAVSMVDTYGLLHQDNLTHVFRVLDAELKPDICLAYHAHNNFQLGYANSIEVLHTSASRDILVDGTLYGMGKSAGNTPIELLAMYMNDNLGKAYDINQLLEAIEVNILDIYRRTPWGYNFFYYVSAANKCHPNYVSYLMNKRTLSIKSITEILGELQGEERLLYDQKRIEQLYLAYQRNECNDTEAMAALQQRFAGKTILILGPGRSIGYAREKIEAYIQEHNPVIMAINFVPEGYAERIQYIFLTNAKRYAQMATVLAKQEQRSILIATSNIIKTQGQFPFVLNYSSLIDPDTDIPDNSLVMLLKALKASKAASIALAGFDGYSEKEMNYYNTNMEYDFAKEKAAYLNHYVKTYLEREMKDIEISFVTESYYNKGEEKD